MAGGPGGPPPQGESPREAGAHILQHYQQMGSPPVQLQRVRIHLIAYYRHGGDIPQLERKVFTEKVGPHELIVFIEGAIREGPRGAGPDSATKVTCAFCGSQFDASREKCPNCGGSTG